MMNPFKGNLGDPKAGKTKPASVKAGTGFGTTGMKLSGSRHKRGTLLASEVHKHGVVKISNAISPDRYFKEAHFRTARCGACQQRKRPYFPSDVLWS